MDVYFLFPYAPNEYRELTFSNSFVSKEKGYVAKYTCTDPTTMSVVSSQL